MRITFLSVPGLCRHGVSVAGRTRLLLLIVVHCCLTNYYRTSCQALPTAATGRLGLLSDYRKRPEAIKNLAIVEDDIRITDSDPYVNDRDLLLRSTVSDKSKAWAKGVVPFYIDATFFNEEDVDTIYSAIEEFHSKTCVRFVPREDQSPYLFITPLSRCWSEIGMPTGEGIRTLSLGSSCLERRGTVIHELMHVLGFWHEQNRADRDDYIVIHWENIREGLQHNFYKYSAQKVDTVNEPYDYQSIMHYSSFAFAKDPRDPTIEPRLPVMIGQRFELSPVDVRKINRVYNCSDTGAPLVDPGADVAATRTPFRTPTVAPPTADVPHRAPLPPSRNGPSNDAIIFPSSKEFPLLKDPFSPISNQGSGSRGVDSRPGATSGSSSSGNSSPGSHASGSSQSHSPIIFPNIKDYVPLPFKFDWSRTTINSRIVFPD